MDEKENTEWIAKDKLTDWYPNRENAKSDFMKDLSEASKRNDVLIFRGWEIWEGELDEGLEKGPMKDAEVIGWHISKAAWDGKAPSGREIIQRAKQILEVQKEFPVPMIIFHPFKGFFDQIKANALKSGRSVSDIKKEEYRYFTPEQQKELIEILKGKSIYLEISRGWATLWDDPVVREAFIEDIHPLAEAGVKFTVSSDAHNKSSFKQPYKPEKYCSDLGITAENINSIVKELLDIRAGKTFH
jgi:histidinol phosphatase-like PHP family hydrolase